jgi:phage/plasmid-like protein (TIGR03299 family)
MTQATQELPPATAPTHDTTDTPFTADPAWNQVGTLIDQSASGPEALRVTRLDWRVVQWPLAAVSPEGWGTVTAKDFVANVREDTKDVLGVVSRKSPPLQNRQAFAFADAIVTEGKARYEAAGALRGGRRVWILLRLDGELGAGLDDPIQPYLLLFHAHDGSACLRALLTSVRVVCANTLNLALSGGRGEGVAIRQLSDAPGRPGEAQRMLDLAHRRFSAFGLEVDVFRSVSMTGVRLRRYFDSLLPPLVMGPRSGERERDNRLKSLDRLNANFEDELNTLPGMRGTLWAALNAATEFADHQRKIRGSTDLARRENRLDSVWFGSANDFKQAAYRSALELAGLN